MVVEAFDGASALIAGPLKMGAPTVTDAFAPELLAYAEEIPAGLFLTGLGRKLVGALVGLGALGGAMVTGGRDKGVLLHMGAHFVTHPDAPGLWGLLNVSPSTPSGLASELAALKAGVAQGDWNIIRSAFAFTPDDVASYFRDVSAQWQQLFAAGGPGGAAPSGAGPTPQEITEGLAGATSYGDFF